MAISGANLAGAFPVYKVDKALNTYAANVQKQQAQRQAELKELNDSVSKIKIDGLREADKAKYYEKFNEWKNEAQSAYKDRDNKSKFQKQSNADLKFLELQDFINQSKTYGKSYQDLKGRLMDDRFRNQFSDNAVRDVQESDKLSIADPRFIKDFTGLERQIDTSKVFGNLKKRDDFLLGKQRWVNEKPVPGKESNVVGEYVTQSRAVPIEEQAADYVLAYNEDRDLKALVQRDYAQLFDQMPEEQAVAAAMLDLAKKRSISEFTKPEFKKRDTTVDNIYLRERLRGQREDAKDAKVTPATFWQDVVNKAIDGEADSGEFIFDNISSNIAEKGQDLNGKINLNKNRNGTITVIIPSVTKTEVSIVDGKAKNKVTQIKPEKKFTYNPKDRLKSAKTLTDIINIYTGERVSYSKQFTSEGKGKVLGGRGSDELKKGRSGESKMVRVILPSGQSGEIPSENLAQFLKDNPKAKRQ